MSTYTLHTSQGPQRTYAGFLSLSEERLAISKAQARQAPGPVSQVSIVPILHPYDLSREELAEFDYLLEEDTPESELETAWADTGASFFRFKGTLYDLGEFVRIVPPGEVGGGFAHYDHSGSMRSWDGIRTDSYFSGVVVKHIGEGELLRVGLYCC